MNICGNVCCMSTCQPINCSLVNPAIRAEQMQMCVYDGARNHPSVQFCFFHQGVNRAGKGAQLGRNGVRRKDWHDYEAIKRDASRSGLSKSLFITSAKMKLNEERCFWICTHIQSVALLVSSKGVNLCFGCITGAINTVYIFYNHH